MSVVLARLLVTAVATYAAIGLVVAIPFVSRGVNRIDPDAREGTWGFRLLMIPGTVTFWPLLLRRWWTGAPPPDERSPHRGGSGP